MRWTWTEEADSSLSEYLRQLRHWCDDAIVVDGSPPEVFEANAVEWNGHVRHVRPDPPRPCLNGKVAGVTTGIALARHEYVVIADDDVRYDESTLRAVVALLGDHDLVRPQNFFCPLPWHAVWDTARTLLNRATGADFPGTFGVRRSRILAMGGYDGDVLFENLELIRTVQASGGSMTSPLDLFVRRLPPTVDHFWAQRTRQAYDDFAMPVRMVVWLSVIPSLAGALATRRWRSILAAAAMLVLLAEYGRHRGAGTRMFPAVSSALAPAWVAERGVCAWLAVLQRLRFGGVRYGDGVIRVAANRRAPRRPGWSISCRGRSEQSRLFS